jgi:glutathione S-transferase
MATSLVLVIGSKRLSSWSLRPWLAMRQGGVPFEERLITLDTPTTHAEIRQVSPSGRVPVLLDGELAVWDSLAICEYVAEAFPAARLWPADARARAVARAVSAEMHAGFGALRAALDFDLHRSGPPPFTPAAEADLTRIVALWTDCRARFGSGGPFLFGAFSIADAMYAPVVLRARIYDVRLLADAEAYAAAICALPATQEWIAAGRAEAPTLTGTDHRPSSRPPVPHPA